MTSVANARTRNLHALLKRLGKEETPGPSSAELRLAPVAGADPDWADPARELVYSLLLWEAGAAKAGAASKRLSESVVDLNELRTCLEDEIVGLLGPRYPRAAERAARLRAALNHVFRKQNTVSLARLREVSKREARTSLESIEGLPPFVSARVLLVSLGGHAFPLDRRLHRVLAEEDAVEPATYSDSAGSWAERQVRAGEALDAYLAVERLAEGSGARRKGSSERDAGRASASDKQAG